MPTQLQAIFENGVLRPLQPFALAEHQRVTITISSENGDGVSALETTHVTGLCLEGNVLVHCGASALASEDMVAVLRDERMQQLSEGIVR
jgi:predicted DNA-binding antitoxin AbrB/MazE fold protein